MRNALQAPPVNWNEIYLALNTAGFSDPRFHAASFGRQPRRHIFKALEAVHRRERDQANALSISTARLAQIVQFAASMGKANSELQDFLPYQIDTPDSRPRLSAAAAGTLRSLIQGRKLPMAIMAFLMEDLQRADVLL